METQCFEAQFRVHPTKLHPSFKTINFGILTIWLFDLDKESATTRAKAIAVQYPYHVGDGKVIPLDDGGKLLPYQEDGVAKAGMLGINVELQWYDHTVNEQENLKDWPYLVPPINVQG